MKQIEIIETGYYLPKKEILNEYLQKKLNLEDDYIKKPNSMLFDENLVIPTLINALNNKQIQPVLEGNKDD